MDKVALKYVVSFVKATSAIIVVTSLCLLFYSSRSGRFRKNHFHSGKVFLTKKGFKGPFLTVTGMVNDIQIRSFQRKKRIPTVEWTLQLFLIPGNHNDHLPRLQTLQASQIPVF